MTVLESEKLLRILIPTVSIFVATVAIIWWFYRREKKKRQIAELENAILRIKQYPDDLDLYKIYEIYLDISGLKKQTIFFEFSKQAEEAISKSIMAQTSFVDLNKFFAGWSSYQKDFTMILLHKAIAETTRDHVRKLGKDYWEELKNEEPKVRTSKFLNAINKPYYLNVYDLHMYFYNEIDSVETLEKQRRSSQN